MNNNINDQGYYEFKIFAAEFLNETDRAAVILGAAKLDILLYQILERFLLAEASSTDVLLDGDSPLATFSAKIKLVYRLGLIDKDIARALNLVRRIRNSFAHELSGISLNTGSHRDRVKELVAPFKVLPGFQQFLNEYFKDKPGPAGEFRAVVATLSLRLEGLFDAISPIDDKNAFTLIPPLWLETTEPYGRLATPHNPTLETDISPASSEESTIYSTT